jgi:hypothetical protein
MTVMPQRDEFGGEGIRDRQRQQHRQQCFHR